jgi:hypothetical protein
MYIFADELRKPVKMRRCVFYSKDQSRRLDEHNWWETLLSATLTGFYCSNSFLTKLRPTIAAFIHVSEKFFAKCMLCLLKQRIFFNLKVFCAEMELVYATFFRHCPDFRCFLPVLRNCCFAGNYCWLIVLYVTNYVFFLLSHYRRVRIFSGLG